MPRIQSHHLHLPFYHIDDSRNMRLLFATRIIRDIVNKVSLFFLPIFLFQLGQNIEFLSQLGLQSFQKGAIILGGFYFLAKILSFIFGIPLGNLIQKIGYHKAFTYSYLLRLIEFLALYFSVQQPLLLLVAIVLEAIQSNIFWCSYLTILSKNALKNNIGKDLSLLQFALQIIATVIPAGAGLIASWLGLEVLFLLGFTGTLIAFIFASQMTLNNDQSRVSWKELKTWFADATFSKLAVAQAGRYIHDSILFLWPLYVYLIFGTVEKVGFLYTISLFLVLTITVFGGTYVDRSKTKKPFYMSGGVMSFLWLCRIQAFSVVSIALIDAFDKLLSNFHWLYYDTIFLRRGKGKKALAYFVYTEMANTLATATFWLLFLIFFLFFNSWTAIFIFAAIGVMMSTLISDRDETLKA